MDELLHKESIFHGMRKTGNHVSDEGKSGLLCSEIIFLRNNNPANVEMGHSRYFLWFAIGDML